MLSGSNRALEATMGFNSSIGASSILPQLMLVKRNVKIKKEIFDEGKIDFFNDKEESHHTDLEVSPLPRSP
jgi:hypothetical protein